MVRKSIIIVLSVNVILVSCFMDKPMLGKIRSGFQLAGKFLGFDQTSGVAQMVAETFGKTASKGDSSGAPNIFSGFLRLLGLDSKKLGAIAVNAIIFVAQLISTTLSKPPPSQLTQARTVKSGTPLDWMMNNTKLTNLISQAKDAKLPDHIVGYIKERSLDEDTGCIQLLVCKSAPFIWGMQKTLNMNSKKAVNGSEALFTNIPSMEEIINHGDECEEKHPFCLVY